MSINGVVYRRFLRVLFANVLSGGISAGLYFLTTEKEVFYLIPILSPILSAVGKLVREKYKADIVI